MHRRLTGLSTRYHQNFFISKHFKPGHNLVSLFWCHLHTCIIGELMGKILLYRGATTLSITTLSIMTFSIKTLSIRGLYVRLGISDSQHK
jgi:hypothetical protein